MQDMNDDHPTPLKSTLGFEDPRQEDVSYSGQIALMRRTLNTLEQSLGSYAALVNLQQKTMPKGGATLKAEWWQPWKSKTCLI